MELMSNSKVLHRQAVNQSLEELGMGCTHNLKMVLQLQVDFDQRRHCKGHSCTEEEALLLEHLIL